MLARAGKDGEISGTHQLTNGQRWGFNQFIHADWNKLKIEGLPCLRSVWTGGCNLLVDSSEYNMEVFVRWLWLEDIPGWLTKNAQLETWNDQIYRWWYIISSWTPSLRLTPHVHSWYSNSEFGLSQSSPARPTLLSKMTDTPWAQRKKLSKKVFLCCWKRLRLFFCVLCSACSASNLKLGILVKPGLARGPRQRMLRPAACTWLQWKLHFN